MTFEDLITSQNGVTAARALVNVVIDQQIGQQISVRIRRKSAALG
jgi:nuclear pore complex protein Nup155